MSGDIIREKLETIKGKSCLQLRIIATAAVISIGVGAFFLGALWQESRQRPTIYLQDLSAFCPDPIPIDGAVYASWRGRYYYAPWCKANIKYKRWFPSEEAARQAGYRPAKNCKGLNRD